MSKQDSSKHKWVRMDWDGEAMWPFANFDLELITGRFKKGDSVYVQFKNARSLPRQRLYWSLVRQVFKNNTHFGSENSLHKMLLLACGVTEPLFTVDGDIQLLPSSTAFEAMEEDEFRQYFDKAMEIITTKIMPGTSIELLLNEAKSEARWQEAA